MVVYVIKTSSNNIEEFELLYGSNYTIYISTTITSHDLIPKDRSSKIQMNVV